MVTIRQSQNLEDQNQGASRTQEHFNPSPDVYEGNKRWSQTRKTSHDENKTTSMPKTMFLSEERSKQTLDKDTNFQQ